MLAASAIGVLAFIAASLVVGVRLIRLSGDGYRLPSLSIGLAFVLSGGLGFVLLFSTVVFGDALGAGLPWMHAAGLVSVNVGAGALWLFTWRTFRPGEAWAAGLFAAAALAMLASLVFQAATDGFNGPVGLGPWFWVGFVARALSLVWTAIESFRYFVLMQRRVRIGLAEPLLANRFLLWGTSATAAAITASASAVTVIVGSGDPGLVASLRLVGAGFGLAAAAAQWFAFFPPDAYRRHFQLSVRPGAPS